MTKLVVTGPTEVTEGFTGNWRIALPAGVTTQTPIVVGITPATTGNTTTGADFTGGYPITATIPKGQPYIDIPFEAKSDGIVEGQERLEMNLSLTGFTFTKQIGMDVKDTDPASLQIKLTAGSTIINEGAATLITATLDGFTSTSDIDVVLSAGGTTTAATGDYEPLGTIHINAGATSGTFTLQAKADLLLEGDETLAVRGAAGSYTVLGEDVIIKDVTGTTANKTLSMTPVSASIAEGNTVKMTVGLPTGIITTQAITVTIAKGAGSHAGITTTDYTIPATVTIPANGNNVEFDVEAKTDALIEPSELLEVTAGGTVFGYASSDASQVTITDVSNKQITVTGGATVAEGGNLTWRFALPAGVTASSDINITLSLDPASTAGLADLNGISTLRIEAGQPFGEITFSAKADQVIESTETMKFIPATAATGFTFTQPVSFTITDNDLAAAAIELSVAPGTIAEGGSAVVKATLTGGVTATGAITVTLQKGAASTITNGEHNTLGSIVIPAGDTEGTFTVTTNADLLLEATELLVMSGTATSSIPVNEVTLQVTDATGTLANKTLQISPLTATLQEGDDVQMTVGLPAGIITTQDIVVAISKGAGSAATLTSGDYAFPASVTIEAGKNNATFTLEANTDGLIEAAELLELKANASVFGNNSTATSNITITDVSNKHITVTGGATVAENGNVTWRFALPTGITASSDINIALTRNTASTAAMADLNTLPVLKIASGQPFGEITFSAKADLLIEPAETMIFDASATGFTFSQPVTFTITDGDLAAAGITLSAAPGSIAEGAGAVIKATLTGGVTSASNIVVSLAKNAASTLKDTEHGALGTITIAAGATEGTFSLSTNTDQVLEPTETLVLGGTATSSIPVTGATLQVTDATGTNANKTISLTPATATIVESGKVTMTVSLPAGITTAGPITINLAKGAGSSASLTTDDYSFPSTVTIDADGNSKSFDVTAVADALIESPELLELTATATVYGYTSGDASNITITDVSNKHITVSGPATVAEGATVTWRFELPSGVTATSDITISLTADPGSTASLADLTGVPSLKILAGQPHADITFTAKATC